ncbi:MAG: hypothetical protein A2078_14980 [Nitrospirae bacterium GWC2_57_9]|nr:MAG: hypothetical protein A2078_14980 [Nitrospirae bacterium GWC2_57_9]
MSYLIETPHNEAECLRALDEQLAKGTEVLNNFYYGCKTGDHTGYAIVDVESEGQAKKLVPDFLLDKSIITEVSRFTPEMIRSFHQKAA